MKKILSIFLFILLQTNFIFSSTVMATNIPIVENQPTIYDEADLLTDEEELSISEKIEAIRESYHLDIVIVTTNDSSGYSSSEYIDDFYDYNGYQNDGIGLLVAMDKREWATSTKGLGISYFTDSILYDLEDSLIPFLSQGEYSRGFLDFVNNCEKVLYRSTHEVTPTENYNPAPYVPYTPEKKTFSSDNLIISAIVAFIVSLITGLILRGQLKSVAKEYYAGNYINDKSFALTGRSDHFIDRKIERTRIYHDDGSTRSGSSGSSTHISSSGSSHGGHSGKF